MCLYFLLITPRRLYNRQRGVERSVASVGLSVCLSVCPPSKKKTAWAMSTKARPSLSLIDDNDGRD